MSSLQDAIANNRARHAEKVSPPIALSSGRIANHVRMDNGAQQVVMSDGSDVMTDAEWDEYAAIIRSRSKAIDSLRAHADKSKAFNCYGRGIAGSYYGPQRKAARAAVLSDMTGETVRQSDSRVGWNRWISAMFAAIGIAPDCFAGQEKQLNSIVFPD